MKKQNFPHLRNKILALSIALFVTLALIATIQSTYAQSNNAVTTAWSLNLSLRSNNESSSQHLTFAPFDLIQITASLTKGNLTAPNILVVFNVKGPSTSSFPTEITKSSATDNSSAANITFRIPLETNEKSVLGTWQIYANAKTSNGTLQQKSTFQVDWPIQVLSANFLNSKNQNQTIFAPGDEARAILTLNANQEQTENIDLNIQDSTEKIIDQTQIQNISFNTTSPNQISYEFKIPTDTSIGSAKLNARVSSGTYEGVEIPSAQNTAYYFFIGTTSTPTPTPNTTPTPTPFTENTVSLFSWILIATGIFTFTALYMFLKHKPMPKIGAQMPNISSPTSIQTTTPQAQPTSTATLTAKIVPEKTINATMATQLPSIYETLEMPPPQSTSAQEQKQSIVNYLTKISGINERVQSLEAEIRIEKEQLNKEINGLTKILEEQERAVKNYFDSIRQEIAKITPKLNDKQASPSTNKNTSEEQNKKDDQR
jgi:hypothetical protein